MSQKGKENKKEINWGLITASVCLLFNGILFLTLEGSGLPIPTTLYNMILLLVIIMVSLHQKEMYGQFSFKGIDI